MAGGGAWGSARVGLDGDDAAQQLSEAANVSPAPPVFDSSVLLRLRQLPASGVEFDGQSHDLVLESTNLGGVLGLSPQLLAQAIDFHGPAHLMGLLAQLGPLRPCAGRRGGGFSGVHALSHLSDVGRHFGRLIRRRFLAPDLEYPRRFADRPVAIAQLAPQSAAGEASAARHEFAAGASDPVIGQSSIHGDERTPNRFQGEHVPFHILFRVGNGFLDYGMTRYCHLTHCFA
jgi:hypothetical protein